MMPEEKGEKPAVMEKAYLLILLALNSRRDIRTGTIPVLPNLLAGAFGCAWSLANELLSFPDLCFGLGLGGLVLLVGLLTNEAVGFGDGLLLMVTGSVLGGKNNLLLFFGGLMAAGFGSFFLFVFGKAGIKTAIPFVPFLLLAYMGMVCV